MPKLQLPKPLRRREETQLYLRRESLRRVPRQDTKREEVNLSELLASTDMFGPFVSRNSQEVPTTDVVIKITIDQRRIWSHIPRYTCFAADCQETGHKGRLLPCRCRYVLCQEHANQRKPMLKLVREHPDHILEG